MMKHTSWPELVLVSGLSLLPALIGFYLDSYPWQLIGAMLLVGVGPGLVLLGGTLRAPLVSWLAWSGAVLASSYALAVVALMSLSYLTGVLTPIGVLVTLGGVVLGLLISRRFWISDSPVPAPTGFSGRFVAGLLLIAGLAAVLRLWGIQYSDLQGDEAEILTRAGHLLLGTKNTLITHSKGPAEILIVAAFGALTGRLDEFTVRLPFALANLGGVIGVAWLGRRLFGSGVGLTAGALLAINGVFVTYARTAQYQSLMFLFSVWAAYFFFSYRRQGRPQHLLLGSFLLAAAFLTHFEAILLTPLPAFLLWRRLGFDQTAWRRAWPWLAIAAGLLFIPIAAFYIPTLLNPQLSETSGYLAGRIGSHFLHNNFPQLYVSTLTYNAFYYLILIGLLLGGAVLALLNRLWPGRPVGLGLTLAGAIGLGLLLAVALPALQPAYLLLLTGVIIAACTFSSRLPDAARGLVVWAAPAWLAYLHIVARPGNHYYVFFPAAALLAGWGAMIGYRRLSLTPLKLGLGALFIAGFILSSYYQYLLVVRNDLQYLLTYPEHRHPLFVTDPDFPFGTRIGFGFPYRLGWQMVGHLYRTGGLKGNWSANDEGNTLEWYTQDQPRADCYPRHVMLGQTTYKEIHLPLPFDLEANDYSLQYQIWGNDRLRMEIYTLDPLQEIKPPQKLVEPQWYPSQIRLEELALTPTPKPMTRLERPVQFSLSTEAKARLAERFDPRLTEVEDQVELIGYHLDESWARPGGAALLTLYWQAVTPLHLPLKIFVHLEAGPVNVQADDFPACGEAPMPRWSVGRQVADPHLLHLPLEIKPGRYPLTLGIYEPETGLRMDRLDQAGNPAGISLSLSELVIRSEKN